MMLMLVQRAAQLSSRRLDSLVGKQRYKSKIAMGNWWIIDALDRDRVIAMCSRGDDADMIMDALANDTAHLRAGKGQNG
jgi:hypothetical protein